MDKDLLIAMYKKLEPYKHRPRPPCPMVIHWSPGMIHQPMYLPPDKRFDWMNGRMYLPATESLPETESYQGITEHRFHHYIKIDRVSLKLDKRVEALEKRMVTPYKKKEPF